MTFINKIGIGAIAIISVCIIIYILYLIFKPKEQNAKLELLNQVQSTISTTTFGTSGLDYSTTSNIEKSFIIGTINDNVMITSLSLTFDNNSVFNSSSIKISIQDNNNELYNTIITNFSLTPIIIKVSNIIVNKDSKVILILNGVNTIIYNPNITFSYFSIPTTIQTGTFPPSTTTTLNTKVWSTIISTNPYAVNFPELCPNVNNDYGINIPNINKVSFAISGGGSRSFTAMVGYFRALNRMGYKNKAQYVSSISGGNWFYGLYAFSQTNTNYTDELLLGKSCGLVDQIFDPSKITLNLLTDTNKQNSLYYGHIFENKDLLEYAAEALFLKNINIDSIYNYCIGKIILEKYGLNQDVPIAVSSLHANDISTRNIFNGSPLAMPPNMPFWICNTTLFFNYVSQYPYAIIPMTPLYSGIPQIITQNTNTIGGYLVENFAFGNTEAPTSFEMSFNNPPCLLPYFANLKKTNNIRTLRDMLGVSSTAFAGALYMPQNISSILSLLLPSEASQLIPLYNIWGNTPPIATSSDSQCTNEYTTGGCKAPNGYDKNSCTRVGAQCYSITAPQCYNSGNCKWSWSNFQCINKDTNNSNLTCRRNPSFFNPLGCKCISAPTYTASTKKVLNNQMARLSDGAFSDNLGILSLLARGVKKIICFVNGIDNYDSNCDIQALFGIAADSCVTIGSLANNQIKVFNSADYTNILIPQFKENTKNGGPAFARVSLNVLQNLNNCILGGYNVDLILINLQPCDRFLNILSTEVKNQISSSGSFNNFPRYKTFFQNLNFGIISLTLQQFNLLSTYTDWCLNQPELKTQVQQMFT